MSLKSLRKSLTLGLLAATLGSAFTPALTTEASAYYREREIVYVDRPYHRHYRHHPRRCFHQRVWVRGPYGGHWARRRVCRW